MAIRKLPGPWVPFGKGEQQEITGTDLDVGPHRRMATPLQTATQRAHMRGQAFRYARERLLNSERLGIGRAPFSHIDAETIAQQAWADGYIAALRDIKKQRGES